MGFTWIAALALAASAPAAAPAQPEGYLVARVAGSPVVVRARPGGTPVRELGRQTEFGSPQTFTVVRKRGDWLGAAPPRSQTDGSAGCGAPVSVTGT